MFDLKLSKTDEGVLARVASILEAAFVPGDGSPAEKAYLLAKDFVAKQPPYHEVARALCQELNMMFPDSAVSFGYIGNVDRQQDDRSWRFFMRLPDRASISFGGVATDGVSEFVSNARYELGGWVVQNALAEGRYVDDSMIRLWICRHPRGAKLDYPFGPNLSESRHLGEIWEMAARDPYGPERTALACLRQSDPENYIRARLMAERGIAFDELDEGIRKSPHALRDVFGDAAKNIVSTEFIRSLRQQISTPGL